MSKVRLYAKEIEALKALVLSGYTILVTEEASQEEIARDGWQGIWGRTNAKSIVLENLEQVAEFFSAPFEVDGEPKIFCYLPGTHCGGLHFQFGWVHNVKVKKEDLQEAVMPQLEN